MSERESEAMDDLEMVRACAEAMGLREAVMACDMCASAGGLSVSTGAPKYWPLTDDAQAMALVKRFDLEIRRPPSDEWWVMGNGLYGASVDDADLNRAIVRCVSVMFGEK
jgi:hypothetical protein